MVHCHNCGQETNAADCQWCGFPLGSSAAAESGAGRSLNHIARAMAWAIGGMLLVSLSAIAFVHASPGFGLYIVRSDSMKPALNAGDMVVAARPGGMFAPQVQPDGVITFEHKDELITHRVVSVSGNALVTMGDALEEPDPWVTVMDQVKGVYLFKIPAIGYLSNFTRTKTGWLAVVIAPALLLVGLLVRGIVREAMTTEGVPRATTDGLGRQCQDVKVMGGGDT